MLAFSNYILRYEILKNSKVFAFSLYNPKDRAQNF